MGWKFDPHSAAARARWRAFLGLRLGQSGVGAALPPGEILAGRLEYADYQEPMTDINGGVASASPPTSRVASLKTRPARPRIRRGATPWAETWGYS